MMSTFEIDEKSANLLEDLFHNLRAGSGVTLLALVVGFPNAHNDNRIDQVAITFNPGMSIEHKSAVVDAITQGFHGKVQ